MRDHDVRTAVMHGNMSQNARERSLSQFESGRVSTLIATDVAARGLDVDEITHVINFDPPHTDDDYVHRIGRTGRAGRAGTGVTLVLPEQRLDVSRLAGRLGHGAAFAASGIHVPGPAPKARGRPAAAEARRQGMSKKRNPQTAAKREREQAMRERRERKRLKKQARVDAAAAPEPTPESVDDAAE